MAPSFGITPRGFLDPSRRHDLRVGFTMSANTGRDPIFPATCLQVSYKFGRSREIFGQVFTARDVVSDESDGGVYYIGVPSKNVPVARAASEEHLDVEVSLHAWKDQKYLNSWIIGEIQRWGTLSEEVRAGR
ncbi:hypothetical protein VCV18_009722 [Metarhizium anisopliae]